MPGTPLLHVDMDAFYAAVEVLDDPRLAGLPLIVGGEGARGVVASCSYQARVFGVRSAMSSAQARRRCPVAVFRAGRFERYNEVSAQLHEIFASFTPLVEGIALDEAFLDVSGAARLLGSPSELAAAIRHRVSTELGLDCSVGVASTKVVAKLASEAAKPTPTPQGVRPGRGVVVVNPGEELEFLHPLPVEKLWGVGPVTAGRLRALGVITIGQLANLPVDVLSSTLGRSQGRHLHGLSLGIDERRVEPDRAVKSIGQEETYARDRYDSREVAKEVIRLADAVAERLRLQSVAGRTITVKLRHADFSTITRSRTLEAPTDEAHIIAEVATHLVPSADVARGVRLLGVSVAHLSQRRAGVVAEQLELDLARCDRELPAAGGHRTSAGEPAGRTKNASEAWAAAADAVTSIRRRYGSGSVGPAVLVGEKGLRLRHRGDSAWGPGGESSRGKQRDDLL